ncbi:MAG: hypothetical protein LLF96_04175 [Eubacteriales bacterium]|nr:hypothetical protein [Eubacteriales bacterium]
MEGRKVEPGEKPGEAKTNPKGGKKRPYLQYSKRFEIAALAIGCIAFLTFEIRVGDSPEYQYKALMALLEYTFGIIAVYNGNSVSEKYFGSKYHLFTKTDDEA